MFPTFQNNWLAIAGVAAATVPIIVHLLNRRNFRVVHWAAMDFLRVAVTRSRRILELRDLLLLALRVLCLLAFGLALGRPYWSQSSQSAADPNQPVHAVVLVDNSLSMGYYRPVKGILLDDAKAKAKAFIESLPRGSAIAVVPTCESALGDNMEPYSRPEDAIEALSAIKPIDRATRPGAVLDRALKACDRQKAMPIKRVFLVTDQQAATWSAEAAKEQLAKLPKIEVEQVTANPIENAWVADVQLRDGVADTESPAVFLAKIGYQGPGPRSNVQVTLAIEGVPVCSQTIDLRPGQLREVQFPEYRFPMPAEPGKSGYAAVEVSIPPDQLPGDDQRGLVVPVVASLPVVFIDSVGEDESPKENRYGDTYWLRRLLAPRSAQSEDKQQLIKVRQLKAENVTREALSDVRLVVWAGTAAPSAETVAILTEYVEQGGNLILAGGGDFDPAAWSQVAWKEGLGILPAPLSPDIVGKLREEMTEQDRPFVMNFDSLTHQYFQPEGVGEEELRELLGPPTLFFKAVVAQCDERVQTQASQAAEAYFTQQRKRAAEITKRLSELDSAGGSAGKSGDSAASRADRGDPASQTEHGDLLREREKIQPSWLTWRKGSTLGEDEGRPIEELARRAAPVVLGSYDNAVAMLVRRQWGKGEILLFTSSLSPQWTTMPQVGQSWWLMDRIVRSMLAETFPPRNIGTEGAFVLPVAVGERTARYTLTEPDGQQQPLTVEALGSDRYGISLGNWTRRGIYRVTAMRVNDSAESEGVKLWEAPLAVNGPVDESVLSAGDENKRDGQVSFADAANQASSFVSATVEGANFWKWLIGLVLGLLLVELLLTARSTARPEPTR